MKNECKGCSALIDSTFKYCDLCRGKRSASVLKYSIKMNKLGLCMRCQQPRGQYQWVCDGCMSKQVESGRKLSAARRANGICRECTEKVLETRKVCMKHYFQQISAHMLGTMTKYLLLIDLYTLQRGKCFYCQDELCFQMECDHFMPEWLFPELAKDINNLVFTCIPCNQSKKGMLPNQYMDHCKKVAAQCG